MKARAPLAERLKKGLREIIAYEKGEITLRTREIVLPEPPRQYTAAEVVRIRKRLGYSQAIFARVVAVSVKTVRGWEQGLRHPSGSASRVLQLLDEPAKLRELATLTAR